MNRTAVGLFVIVAAGVASLGCASATPGATSARPALLLVGTDPVTFRGTGFTPGEHVRVVVAAPARVGKRTVAGSRGGFTVRFPSANLNECAGFSATATGDRGSRASFKRPPGQCAEP